MLTNRLPDPFSSDDPTFRSIVAALMALPRREMLAIVALFEQWRTWPKDRRAMLAKTICPELREQDVALIAALASGSFTGLIPTKPSGRNWPISRRLGRGWIAPSVAGDSATPMILSPELAVQTV